MTTTNSYSRQPAKQDYADPTKFKFSIIKLPKVEYFCTQVNLPGISISDNYSQPTPFRDIPLPGEKLSYEPLAVTFIVDFISPLPSTLTKSFLETKPFS